jgi:hypothetical protein
MSHDTKRRDALANKYSHIQHALHEHAINEQRHFKAGFDAAINDLKEAAPEFEFDWHEWNGEYEKRFYIVADVNGKIYYCWPNAGKMNAVNGGPSFTVEDKISIWSCPELEQCKAQIGLMQSKWQDACERNTQKDGDIIYLQSVQKGLLEIQKEKDAALAQANQEIERLKLAARNPTAFPSAMDYAEELERQIAQANERIKLLEECLESINYISRDIEVHGICITGLRGRDET